VRGSSDQHDPWLEEAIVGFGNGDEPTVVDDGNGSWPGGRSLKGTPVSDPVAGLRIDADSREMADRVQRGTQGNGSRAQLPERFGVLYSKGADGRASQRMEVGAA
jgi:hypothetical protein